MKEFLEDDPEYKIRSVDKYKSICTYAKVFHQPQTNVLHMLLNKIKVKKRNLDCTLELIKPAA